MDNAIYVGLSRQMLLERELDITANNLANADTVGFKFESLMNAPDQVTTPSTGGKGGTQVTFVTSDGVARDYTQGGLTQTGAPLDVAINGKGFFTISTAKGQRYTRDGRFMLDPTGKLVTQDGDAVQGSGGDITLDPKKGQVSISESGVISQNGETVGNLSLVTFDSLSALSKDGNNLYRNDSNLTPQPTTSAVIKQGMLEASNVQPVTMITRLIEINRAYDAVASMMSSTSSLSSNAIQRLGSLNPT
jgi:flagellar basal-body rod protein FlgF